MSDLFTMLELEHRETEDLLEQLSSSDEGPERDSLIDTLTKALTLHMEFEELRLYPLVPPVMGQESEDEAEIEHNLTREGLAKLAEFAAKPGFGAVVDMVKGGITHHVEEEEHEMFPELRKATDERTLQELAGQLLSARKAAGMPPLPVGQATKEQLLEVAGELGVDGRSSMTKDQLAEAIGAAT